jgi:hypothetical protein
MSKRMNRIALSVLITLAVVAGVYTSVLGASLHAGTTYGSLHVTGGLMLDVSHSRTRAISLNEYYADTARPAQVHDCSDGESAFDPND